MRNKRVCLHDKYMTFHTYLELFCGEELEFYDYIKIKKGFEKDGMFEKVCCDCGKIISGDMLIRVSPKQIKQYLLTR